MGSDDTAATVADTALVSFVDEAPAQTTVDQTKAAVIATLPATGTGEPQALREAGIMMKIPSDEPNTLTSVLYNRVTFDVVNKSPNMEMTLTWEVVF